MDGTILVADDDRTIRTVLTQALTRAGCKVHATSSLTTLMRWVGEGRGDVVISDVSMPDGNGLDMLPAIAKERPGLPVIVISAQNTVMTAIRAAEAEAFDYLPKPFDLPDLMKRTAQALSAGQDARGPNTPDPRDPEELPLVGKSDSMQRLYATLAQVMNMDLPLLIEGESGTGKSLIARVVHEFSDRRARPFVLCTAQDLAAPDGVQKLLSRAGAGTVLIDEICDLDADMQGDLVHAMERDAESKPRFIATTRINPVNALQEGRLRDDLFYRINGATLRVPALRDRIDDLDLLAEHFLALAERNGAPFRRLSAEATQLMKGYSWPGNLRQLDHVVRSLTLGGHGVEIGSPDVLSVLASQPEAGKLSQSGGQDRLSDSVAKHLQRYFDMHDGDLPPPGLYGRILRELEKPLIEIALDATGGNQAKCADLLGINRNTLRKKITELEIEVTRRRKMM